MSEKSITHAELISHTADIIAGHVSHNAVPTADLPDAINAVYAKLSELGAPKVEEKALVPAVPIRKSITDDYLICLEDGKQLKMLKRHLSTAYNMTPDEYRAKWGLPHDYPMVAPAYARTRQALARKIGLGRKPAEKPKTRRRKRS